MLKNFSKLLISLLIILIILSFSISFATEPVTILETENSTNTKVPSKDIFHYGDLYLFGTDIVLDKIVYGSVFIIGNTVEITGQIENDLYVIANTLKIGDTNIKDSGLVQGKIFACANSISFDGACSYLYTISKDINTGYYSFIRGNAKITSYNATIKSAIARDLNLLCTNVSFNEGNEFAAIYGNLNYASNKNIEIPEGIVNKDINHKGFIATLHNYSLKNILINVISAIVTVLVLYIILNKFTPKFEEKLSIKKLSAINLLKAFGIGITSIILVTVVSVLLIIISIGTKLAIILMSLYITLVFFSIPALCITITKAIKTILNLEKKSMFILGLSLVSFILYGLTLIPFVGIILDFIIKITSIGLLLYTFLPQIKLIEKTENSETKKKLKQDKEKIKQEKFEAKVAKKQAKLEAKELKKKDNKDL